ncbi:MAG: c-type cytochrome [Deltaproteobacteria bacterium]|nr:c-type cytochrome [Deltaproteobacteria bacterium]
MRARKLVIAALVLALPAAYAFGKSVAFDRSPPTFELSGRPIGGAQPALPTAAYLTASRIAATADGALVVDADSGSLIKTDKSGKSIAQLPIGRDAGLLTYNPETGMAYVADRGGDRIAVIKVAGKLEVAQSFKTPAEPYGVALTPDKKTLLVTTIADRTMVALDVATGAEKWRSALGREPRGLAVSPDGTRALVSYLLTGTVDQIDLLETHRAEHIAISNAAAPRRCRGCGSAGDAFARASFAVTFMGTDQAIVPFQRETPIQITGGSENTGGYGGGFESPVNHQLAFIGLGKGGNTSQVTAQIAQHQPRAVAWDGIHDALYIAGMGNDTILQIKNASQVGVAEGVTASLTIGAKCGPDGLAVTAEGNVLVWCAFTRSVEKVDFVDAKGALATTAKVHAGPALVATTMNEKQHQGYVLFHSAEPAVSSRGAMACSTCHPDNRTDGLSWRIEKHELQTPILSGRMVGTHPFKWDGGDVDLKTSLTGTMKRLGGFGLDKPQTDALASYIEAMPAVRTPTRDTTQVARGKKLFDAEGCRTCHDGPHYQDNDQHKFTGTLAKSDTPSLRGLAASAPYYHDGSAATLEALLRDRGAVHGMANTAKLSDAQVADLSAFLETL